MDFDTYQDQAKGTRQASNDSHKATIVALLGMAGETGELLSEYKKSIRDGDAHLLHKERVAEELGDLLWYLSDVASLTELRLSDIAEQNLKKSDQRWGRGGQSSSQLQIIDHFDDQFPEEEQLPRHGIAEIRQVQPKPDRKIATFINDQKMGQDLADNAVEEDGYRLHDIFHLACMALLGWSPVIRRGLVKDDKSRKRKSRSEVDEVEDGGRAIVIEEGVSALVFSYAVRHSMLLDIKAVDYELLRTIKHMTSHLEVSVRTPRDWQDTILKAYQVWRQIAESGEGKIAFDFEKRQFELVA